MFRPESDDFKQWADKNAEPYSGDSPRNRRASTGHRAQINKRISDKRINEEFSKEQGFDFDELRKQQVEESMERLKTMEKYFRDK